MQLLPCSEVKSIYFTDAESNTLRVKIGLSTINFLPD